MATLIHFHELTTFPNGKHDDQADSTSQALDWAKQRWVEPGFFKWLRLEHEKLQAEELAHRYEGPNFKNLHKWDPQWSFR